MAPLCPSRRDAAVMLVRFCGGVAKMAATVSANSSAVLWVRVHFDERIIAWQGSRQRGRLSRGATDNSAPLVSHDISYGTRSGDVTVAVPRGALSVVIATPRDFPSPSDDTPFIPRFANRPASPVVILTRGIASIRANITYVHFPSHVWHGLRKRAGWGSMSAPLRLTSLRWQQLSPVPCDVTDNDDASGLPDRHGGSTVPIPSRLILMPLCWFCCLCWFTCQYYSCPEIPDNRVKFY